MLLTEGMHLNIVAFLISECNFDPNISGEGARTPLHLSAGKGHMPVVKYLVEEQGCNPSCLNSDCTTPLMEALINGHLDVVKYLILQ